MMKHYDKMTDQDDWYLAMRQQAAEAEARTQQRRKRALHLISLGVRTVIVTALLFGSLAGLALMLWGGK